jgi:enolase
MDAIIGAIDITGYDKEIKIDLDSAASSFYADGSYAKEHLAFREI